MYYAIYLYSICTICILYIYILLHKLINMEFCLFIVVSQVPC